MHDQYKGGSLLEQKRMQWAKEREEMVGLCGLWGNPSLQKDKIFRETQRRTNALPPIQSKRPVNETLKEIECRPEDESETSGYLSDSPKHYKDQQMREEWIPAGTEHSEHAYWIENKETEDYWAQKKIYKNYRNENWAQHSTDSWMRNGKVWYGTPDSVSSDDGRAKWGDRGVGVGHLWEPVTHQPDSRLPQVVDNYRTPPKWAERELKQVDLAGNHKADILVIHHSDEEGSRSNDSGIESIAQRNFMLGQNVPLPPEIIEERERKRRKAQEHQDAIRKQLEERERKRKEERETRIREERLEEERIRRDKEIERLRLEEEQKRNKEKEEKEKRKEEAMKEALQNAEKLAKAAKKKPIRKQVSISEESPVRHDKRKLPKTPRVKIAETEPAKEETTKRVRDSACQFETPDGGAGVQLVNMNTLAMEGGLALVLDTPQPQNNILMSSEGMQLALLMSPGNQGQLIPLSLSSSLSSSIQQRVLTPSKFRAAGWDKATQTDRRCCSEGKHSRADSRNHRHGQRSGRISRYSDSSEKSNSLERPHGHAHAHCQNSSRFRSRSQPRLSIEDRPKWGINRPAVQYKKQSEKDPYYQRRILRMKMRKSVEREQITEKLLESEMRLLKFETDEEDPSDRPTPKKDNLVLLNGYRMNSSDSSPRFVPIHNESEDKRKQNTEFVQPNPEESKSVQLKDIELDIKVEVTGAQLGVIDQVEIKRTETQEEKTEGTDEVLEESKKEFEETEYNKKEQHTEDNLEMFADEQQTNEAMEDDVEIVGEEQPTNEVVEDNVEIVGEDLQRKEEDSTIELQLNTEDDQEVVIGTGVFAPGQIEAIETITSLRKCLQQLERDMPSTRSGTPFSTISEP